MPSFLDDGGAEEQFRGIVESAAVGIWTLDLETRVTFANQRQADLLGYSPDEMIGRSCFDFMHPEDRGRGRAGFARRLMGETAPFEYRGLRKDGGVLWLQYSGSPLRNAAGHVVGVLGMMTDVTLRRNAEQALRNSEARLSAALQVAQLGTFEWIVATNQVILDDRSKEIFGFPSGTGITAIDVFARIHPQDRNRVTTEVENSRNRTSRLETEYRVLLPDGSVRWVASANTVIVGPDGAAERMFGVFGDITNRKQHESRQAFLFALSERLRGIANPGDALDRATQALGEYLAVAQVGYGEFDDQQQHISVARDWTDGRVPSMADRWHVDDFGAPVIAELKRGQTVAIADVTVDAKTSIPKPAFAYERLNTRAMLAVSLLKQGRIVAVLMIHHPEPRSWSVSELALVEEACERLWATVERARAEEALKVSENRYRTLFQSIDEGFCIIEVLFDDAGAAYDYRFVEANTAFEKHTGLDDVVGKTILQMVPDHDKHWFEFYGNVVRTGVPARYANRSTGLRRFFELYAFPVGKPQEHLVAVLFNDVTAERDSEAERELLLAKLKRSNEELSHFARIASHDLKAPLNTITQYSQLLLRRYKGKTLDDDAEQFVSLLINNAQRMAMLISDLLRYSRLSTSPLLAPNPVDAGAIVDAALENLKSEVEQTGAIVTCSSLPELYVESTLLLQLFQNLIENALKYRGSKQPRVHITAAEQEEHGVYQFSVQDNGEGIAKAHQARIFEPFKRLHGAQIAGSGIGLAVCKKIIDRAGGRIWVESEPGQGSTFYFTLPRIPGTSATPGT